MSGYVQALGPCYGCGHMFAFNPHRVPSFEGEPICENCIRVVNGKRRAAGLPEWPVYPDSYAPIEEGQL